MVIEKCADWQLSSALHMIFQAQVIGPGEWQEGHGRPNFNPFLTGHHGIHRRRSQIIFHIKYFMLEKMRKKGSMDDKCDDQNLRGGGQHNQCCNQVFQELLIRIVRVLDNKLGQGCIFPIIRQFLLGNSFENLTHFRKSFDF